MFSEIDRLISQAVISRIAVTIEKLSRFYRQKKRSPLTNQSDILASVVNTSNRQRRSLVKTIFHDCNHGTFSLIAGGIGKDYVF